MKAGIYVFVFFSLVFVEGYGQSFEDTTSTEVDSTLIEAIPKDSDSAFAMARSFAYEGEYEKSRTVLDFLILKFPDYKDIPVFKARTYLYEEKFAKASQEAKAIIEEDTTGYEEPRHVLLLAKRYNAQLDTALFLAGEGLKRDKESEFYHVEKAQILRAQKEFKEALNAADTGLRYHPNNNELQQLRSFLLNQVLFDGVAAGITYDYFGPSSRDYEPWFGAFAQVGKLTKSGTYIGRINYASRLGLNGIQLEGEAYPIVGEGKYFYFNLGISSSEIFPVVKGGAEYFTVLPRSFEGSIGFRYFDFRTIQVYALTGSIAYYWGRNYLQYRPFFVNEALGWGNNHNFLYRHFMRNSPDFFQLRAGFGYSLDQRIVVLQAQRFLNTYYAESQYFGIGYRKIFTSKLYGQAEFTITRQEDPEIRDSFFRIYSVSLLLGHRF